MKKEELVKKVVTLEAENKKLLTLEKERLEEFAKIFKWSSRSNYSYEYKVDACKWSDVFCKVGKLLARDAQLETETRLMGLEMKLSNIEPFIRKLKEGDAKN
jgi:hypothetical protein